MTLYEIDEAIRGCTKETIDAETGEVIVEVDETLLNSLQMARNEKIENIACWIKELDAESAAIKKESERLQRRAKSASNKADSLRRYLAGFLDGQKWEGLRAKVSFRKTSSVQVDDLSIIPREYLRTKTIEEPDKASIKEAITKLGETIPGARIVQNVSTIVG